MRPACDTSSARRMIFRSMEKNWGCVAVAHNEVIYLVATALGDRQWSSYRPCSTEDPTARRWSIRRLSGR